MRWGITGEVILRGEGAERARKGHLNIYMKWLSSIRGPVSNGDLVILKDESGDPIGLGFYEGIGSIAVRVLSQELVSPEELIEDRLREALSARERVKLGSFFRWVHTEADKLPGLIIDVYDDIAVISSTSIGIDARIEDIAELVRKIYRPSSIILRNDSRPRREVGLPLERRILFGDKKRTVIREGSAIFHVDTIEGQKTGFFIDQRMNRLKVERLAGPGDKVLDLFSYTGGFGIHAALFGARVTAVEESDYAIAEMNENMRLNSVEMRAIRSRAREFLETDDDLYDIVIVDPPAFAPSKEKIDAARRAYVALNSSAMSKVAPGGIIITYSCSLFITKDEFRKIVERASLLSGREIKILEEMGPSPDHPFDPKHPWTLYLKGLQALVL
ncbi:class I SAM-dependent rRNA methyltransferase [Candidatus Korarchaeum cryptofilum]|uniref:Class I SAM-dependent rRNA methyltransferase n=1 Tax=Candidatus Korarchaeum cryptofilum TaxID=498846 RepID=A0A429G6S8_9CREN|nr:class I SAM-dependent rRNA methyltransferase [Candidatus Korarchaeum cryptofilum]RSN69474.1 class I SAM-dependent rRNA methyltransferase [Candidatus Korarchaeum cryptofilum]